MTSSILVLKASLQVSEIIPKNKNPAYLCYHDSLFSIASLISWVVHAKTVFYYKCEEILLRLSVATDAGSFLAWISSSICFDHSSILFSCSTYNIILKRAGKKWSFKPAYCFLSNAGICSAILLIISRADYLVESSKFLF